MTAFGEKAKEPENPMIAGSLWMELAEVNANRFALLRGERVSLEGAGY
jgi:hypothetical protein